jgi:predicted nucleotidyltransferase
MIMNGLDSDKIKSSIVSRLLDVLGENLVAVILAGSFPDSFKEEWSDIDLLIVVRKLDLDSKLKLARVIAKSENDTGLHHGVNVITKEEFLTPRSPEISLEGKTLQALIDLKKYPERIIYLSKTIDPEKVYSPDVDTLKQYSLSNIGMFLKRNRRTLTTTLYTDENKKELLKREIRASLMITKLAAQYFTGKPQGEYQDALSQAKLIFSDFNFEVVEDNFRIIKKWKELNNDKKILEIFRRVDEYIEKFTRYVFKKSQNN